MTCLQAPLHVLEEPIELFQGICQRWRSNNHRGVMPLQAFEQLCEPLVRFGGVEMDAPPFDDPTAI